VAVCLEPYQPEPAAIAGAVAVHERRLDLRARDGPLCLVELELDAQVPAEGVHRRPQERRLDQPALAGARAGVERGEDAGDDRHRRHVVAEAAAERRGSATLDRMAVGYAGARPERAHVVAGPVLVGTA